MSLTSAIPVFRVADYPAAKAFWTDAMAFTLVEEGGDPPRFGIFRQGQATVFVDAWQGPEPQESPVWSAYFHTEDVDALAADLSAKGVALDGPHDAVYGMREITLRDPGGNLLCFGQDSA